MIYRTPPRPTPPYPQVGPGRAGGEGGAPSSRDPEASLRSPGKRRSPLLLLLRLPPFPSPPRALGLDGLAAGRPGEDQGFGGQMPRRWPGGGTRELRRGAPGAAATSGCVALGWGPSQAEERNPGSGLGEGERE